MNGVRQPTVLSPPVRTVPHMRITGYRQTQTPEQWRQQIRRQYPSQFYNVVFTGEGAKITAKPDVPTAYGIDPIFREKMGWARARREYEPSYRIFEKPAIEPALSGWLQRNIPTYESAWKRQIMKDYPPDKYAVDWTPTGATIQEFVAPKMTKPVKEPGMYYEWQPTYAPGQQYIPKGSLILSTKDNLITYVPPEQVEAYREYLRSPKPPKNVWEWLGQAVEGLKTRAGERLWEGGIITETPASSLIRMGELPQPKTITALEQLYSTQEWLRSYPSEPLPIIKPSPTGKYVTYEKPTEEIARMLEPFKLPIAFMSEIEAYAYGTPSLPRAIFESVTTGKAEPLQEYYEVMGPWGTAGSLLGIYVTGKAFSAVGGEAWRGIRGFGKVAWGTSHAEYVLQSKVYGLTSKISTPIYRKIISPIKYKVAYAWRGSALQKYLSPISYQIVGVEQTFGWEPSKFATNIGIPKELALRYAFEAHQTLYYPVALRAYQTELWKKFIQATTPKEAPFTVLAKGKYGWTYETLEPKFAKVSETFKPRMYRGKTTTSLSDTFRGTLRTGKKIVSGESLLEQITEDIPKVSLKPITEPSKLISKEAVRTAGKTSLLSKELASSLAAKFWFPTAKVKPPPSLYKMEQKYPSLYEMTKQYPLEKKNQLEKTQKQQFITLSSLKQTGLKNLLDSMSRQTNIQTQNISQTSMAKQEQQIIQQLKQIQTNMEPQPTPTPLTPKVDYPEIFERRKRRRPKKEFDPFGIYGRNKLLWPTMGPKQVMKMKKLFEV